MAVGPAGHNNNCFKKDVVLVAMIAAVGFTFVLGCVLMIDEFYTVNPYNTLKSSNLTVIGTFPFSRKEMCEYKMSSWLDEMGNDCLLELLNYPFIIIEIVYSSLDLLLYRCKSLRKERSLAMGPIKIRFECKYDYGGNYVHIQIREASV